MVMELTDTEKHLYDRQIRLWGIDSQKNIRSARVLISGLNGVGAEVTKNIILSGIHSVTLQDDKYATEEDATAQFLVPSDSIGCNRAEASLRRARALNPSATLTVDKEPLAKKGKDFFANFEIVVIIGAENAELVRINHLCRESGAKFFACDVWGTFGYYFVDLQKHKFLEDLIKYKVISTSNDIKKPEVVKTSIQKEMEFTPYDSLINFNVSSAEYKKKMRRTGPSLLLLRLLQEFRTKHKRDPYYKTREKDITELENLQQQNPDYSEIPKELYEQVFGQASPAAAVVGGIIAQEIIKVVTNKEAPLSNLFLFDPQTCCGFVEQV